ncbi:hypothetical protein EDEG_01273 [Edhazardia aedis USNM 41457]|uniref:Uncharacterized protein n=1 Tax=Edhazardia aedis (strain USNM 41457) TaxID=1003232 RepID=J9DPM2_EDHAE|nr:hypothetical protein EDEG_01273 [Edhazardia aedis USNM 41457]|eukprot:EJW04505.1 hypothetical protein EDEG_01273 [Edhazardia aedis USNM 41457]
MFNSYFFCTNQKIALLIGKNDFVRMNAFHIKYIMKKKQNVIQFILEIYNIYKYQKIKFCKYIILAAQTSISTESVFKKIKTYIRFFNDFNKQITADYIVALATKRISFFCSSNSLSFQ